MSKRVKRKQTTIRRPKSTLRLSELDHSQTAVLDSLRSSESKRGYRHAIDEFIQWYCSEPTLSFNKTVVTRYGFTSRTAGSQRAQSMGDLPLFVGWPTRLPTQACSAPNWQRVSGVSRASRSWV